jgi:hypothetical protein
MIEAKTRVPEHTIEPEVEHDAEGPDLVPHRPFEVERVRADFRFCIPLRAASR